MKMMMARSSLQSVLSLPTASACENFGKYPLFYISDHSCFGFLSLYVGIQYSMGLFKITNLMEMLD